MDKAAAVKELFAAPAQNFHHAGAHREAHHARPAHHAPAHRANWHAQADAAPDTAPVAQASAAPCQTRMMFVQVVLLTRDRCLGRLIVA